MRGDQTAGEQLVAKGWLGRDHDDHLRDVGSDVFAAIGIGAK